MKLGAVDNGQYFLHDNNKQTELYYVMITKRILECG